MQQRHTFRIGPSLSERLFMQRKPLAQRVTRCAFHGYEAWTNFVKVAV